MTDRDLLEKRLAYVVTYVETLRSRAEPDALTSDPVQRGFVEHRLQTAIQAAIDVASIVVSARRLGEPQTSAGLFDVLAEDGWLSAEQAAVLRRIVAFRNIVVYRYLDVDPAILRVILTDHLDDVLAFVRIVRDSTKPAGRGDLLLGRIPLGREIQVGPRVGVAPAAVGEGRGRRRLRAG